ncbi:hypothetical protein HK405_004190 [Cladochytrium tenue]|nr:hypothetical protein HK405_004190 [Cladochytrium tenue]
MIPTGSSGSPPVPSLLSSSFKQRTSERTSSMLGSNMMLRRNSNVKESGAFLPQAVPAPAPPTSTAAAQQQRVDDQPAYSNNPADYDLGKPIGYGSSAVVYIATYLPLKKTVAIKVIDLDLFERNQIDELRMEIQIMSLSKHPNLLPVYGSFVTDSKLYIVFPFLSAGSCLDIMKTAYQNGLDEQCIATILKQTLQGLDYLHKNGLIHRDVKAGNLLMDDDGLVQLADFGVSSSLMETGERRGVRKTFVGTPCWMAPEVMEQTGYDHRADIWSFGITCLELATGHAPFSKFPPLKVLMLTLQNDPPTLDREQTAHRYSKSFKDLIDSCLQKDPSRRPVEAKGVSWDFSSENEPSEKPPAIAIPPVGNRWAEPQSPGGTTSPTSGAPVEKRIGRFSVTESQAQLVPTEASPTSSPTTSIARGSRFTTNAVSIPLSASLSASSVLSTMDTGAVNERLNTILRQNQQQQALLGELIAIMTRAGVNLPDNLASPAVSPLSIFGNIVPEPPSPYSAQLDTQVTAVLKENDVRRRENEVLRRDYESLRHEFEMILNSQSELLQQNETLRRDNESMRRAQEKLLQLYDSMAAVNKKE